MRLSKTQVDRSGQARAAKDGQYSSGAAEGVEVETVSPTRTKAQPGKASNLMRMGLDEVRAWTSATNGRGPWWNSGASHMNQAFPIACFGRLGLVSLSDTVQRLRGLP